MVEGGILVKALAVLLTIGQLNDPANIKTNFNKETEKPQVIQIMRGSCKSLMDKFKEVGGVDLTQIGNNGASAAGDSVENFLKEYIQLSTINNQSTEIFKGLDFKSLKDVYLQICKGQEVENSLAPVDAAIDFYNDATKALPSDDTLRALKNKNLSQSSVMTDLNGNLYTEIYASEGRRQTIPFQAIPDYVKKAFVAIEDRRFYQHSGVDETGLLRAFAKNMMSGGRPEGASTITQQVIKNLVVGDDVTFQRKIREMIMAARLDKMKILTKDEILSLYLNYIYLGRSSWGVEMAARSYFGKSIKDVSLSQAAFLAGLTHSPNRYNLTGDNELALKRRNEVLRDMKRDKFITDEQYNSAKNESLTFVNYENPRAKSSLYFIDDIRKHLRQEAKIDIYSQPYKVFSTLQPDLQKATEAALQEGLWNYERSQNRAVFENPEGNIAKLMNIAVTPKAVTPSPVPTKIETTPTVDKKIKNKKSSATGAAVAAVVATPALSAAAATPTDDTKPEAQPIAWQTIMAKINKPLVDIQWDLAVVTKIEGRKITVGLKDGREVPLSTFVNKLQLWDLIYVKLKDVVSKNTKSTIADLRTRPKVQGAAVVIENATGRVLSMTGGFSYSVSQLNRASLYAPAMRQAGSTVKPFVYLAALQKGYQPNTLLYNSPRTFALPGRDWSPKNYDGRSSGPVTLRYALENSLNVPTVRWLDHIEPNSPQASFEYIRSVMQDMGVYNFEAILNNPELKELYKSNEKGLARYKNQYGTWSMLLGSAPTRLLDLAAGYATISNGGLKPKIHLVDKVEQNGKVIYQAPAAQLSRTQVVDRASAFQLKNILQGTLLRGTAQRLKPYAEFVGGKTGTSSNNKDVLFAGFTNEVSIVIWVGYDQNLTLGSRSTGGGIAAPIFEDIVTQSWTILKKKTQLAFNDNETQKQLVQFPVDYKSGTVLDYNAEGFRELFKVDSQALKAGRQDFANTQAMLVGQNYQSWDTTAQNGAEWAPQADDEPVAPPMDITPQWQQQKPQQDLDASQRRYYPTNRRQAPAQSDFNDDVGTQRRRRVDPIIEQLWGPQR